jgi:hypothetical protein
VFKSKVCKTFGGVDLPINLYIRAVPSGIGKNKEALWVAYLIRGYCSLAVIVKGKYLT